MKIHIISPGFKYQNSRALLTPLILWNQNFKKYNFKIIISNNILNKYEGDVVIVDSKFHRNMWLTNKFQIIKDFANLKKNFNKVVYCDTADSSGWIQSELLPLVDCYWKFQILKDKKLYLESFYDQRIFTHFYHKNYNIYDEDKDYSSKIANPQDLNKIRVSWNSSMANYSKYSHLTSHAYKFIKFNNLIKYRYKEMNNFSSKTKNIFCRFRYSNYRNTITFHRKKIKEKLSVYSNINFSKTSRLNYFDELKKSKIAISPFGWGEVAYRDFESFINKTILIKPDMSHIETWPNLYVDKKTYLSFNWNLKNILDVIENVLDNYKEYIELANEGFNNYTKYTYSNYAPLYFEKRFYKLITDLNNEL